MPDDWYSEALLVLCAVVVAAVFYHLIDRIVLVNRNRYYSKELGWTLGGIAYALLLIGTLYGRHEVAMRRAG